MHSVLNDSILIFEIQIAAMLSSVKEAFKTLQGKIETDSDDESNKPENRHQSSRRGSSRQKLNIGDLESLLNITRDQAEQLEGNLKLTLAGVQRFIPFDNRTTDKIPSRT
jgi:hypothetical protein